MAALAHTRSPRLYIQTIQPLAGQQRTVTAQFNPVGFEDGVESKYVAWEVPGLSHEVLQFIATKNYELKLELRYIIDPRFKAADQLERYMEYRRIMYALAYPRGVGSNANPTINGVAPHRVLVVLPGLISMTCVVKRVGTIYNRFDTDGKLVDFSLKVEFSEIRDQRITADEVYKNGTNREANPLADALSDFDAALGVSG
jgi:hypothetical protein